VPRGLLPATLMWRFTSQPPARTVGRRICAFAAVPWSLTSPIWASMPERCWRRRTAACASSTDLGDDQVPLGMALHELATNAARYGALSTPSGHVKLIWDVRDVQGKRRLCLEWREHKGPPVHPPAYEGFGSILLGKVLPMQVEAEVEVRFARDGLRCGPPHRAAAGARVLAPLQCDPGPERLDG
jgi:hypothetical protein